MKRSVDITFFVEKLFILTESTRLVREKNDAHIENLYIVICQGSRVYRSNITGFTSTLWYR